MYRCIPDYFADPDPILDDFAVLGPILDDFANSDPIQDDIPSLDTILDDFADPESHGGLLCQSGSPSWLTFDPEAHPG